MDTTVTLPEIVPASYVDAHETVQELDPRTRSAVMSVIADQGDPVPPIVCAPGGPSDELDGDLWTLDGHRVGAAGGKA